MEKLQWKTACESVMANLRSLNKLPSTRVFITAEKWMAISAEVGALFLLKTGTFGAKNW